MEKFIKCYPKSILLYYFADTQIKDSISVTKRKLQYNIGVAMQDNAAQHWWYSTIPAANTVSVTGKITEMVHPDIFGEDGRNPQNSDSEN